MEQADDAHVRVADYLDDKLQTLGDLDSLESLLSNVHNQHALLKKQLDDARGDLQGAKKASQDHRSFLRERSSKFDQEQENIDRRLMIITNSETSDEAVHRFESSMDKLRSLDIANGYVELLKEVEELSKEAQSQLNKSKPFAVMPYKQLQGLVSRMLPLQEAAEGAAPHLVDHVMRTTNNIKRQIKDAFSADVETVLKKISWPKANATIPSNLQEQWNTSVGRLLDLQLPDLQVAEETAGSKPGRKAPAVLFPLEVLAHPLEMRFRYHFEGETPTNRLDKPEYFLNHVTDLLNSYNPFLLDYLQPILLTHFHGTDLSANSSYVDVTSAWITTLLPMLRAKVFRTLPQVATQPQLFSHLMHELMEFDSVVRNEWGYDGGNGPEGWKGLTHEVLVQQDWFGRWLQVEKNFALSRYQSILESADNGELDYDSVDPGSTKPTKAAIRVNDLLETITDRYRPLTSFGQKLRFLIDIQISIFDQFHERLHSGLEAYLSMTSSLGRTVQGISKDEQQKLQGVAGLERLCRIYGSADYLERAMRDWGNDIFFLELWTELQARARRPSTKPLAGPMTVADVAERTSSSVGNANADGASGALFDETAAAYGKLRVRSEGIITDQLSYNAREALRPYRHTNPWATLSSGQSAGTLAPTAELDSLLTLLASSLGFLAKALGPAPLRRITRALLLQVGQVVWDSVLTRHNFSTAGAAQLAADLAAVCAVVDRSVGSGVARAGLRKCLEGVRLVGLPVKGKGREKEKTEEVDEGWEGEAWDEEEDAEAEGEEGVDRDQGGTGGGLGLWDVEKRLFADNQSARAVLEELGMEGLTENEARAVLGRRVELGS